jgi:acetate---CoA ligase (ADP-forming)
VGAGGTDAELWRDVERRLAPLSAADVEALLARPRIGRVLSGWRGEPPLDRPALEKMVRAVGAAALAHPELAELEVNPALVLPLGSGAFAVDVRARLSPAEVVT